MMTDNVEKIEQANFVILTLLRKLYVLAQNKNDKPAEYQQQMAQLQKDLKHLGQTAIIEKVNKVYIPYLQQLTEGEKHEI